jgi:hypothetical protein
VKENRPYSIQKINNHEFLVITKDYTRFDELLPALSNDLKKKKVKGDIVFDLLLSNGNNSTRYFHVYYNGEAFDLRTLKKINNPNIFILQKVKTYLKKNKELLQNSVLTQAEISQIFA